MTFCPNCGAFRESRTSGSGAQICIECGYFEPQPPSDKRSGEGHRVSTVLGISNSPPPLPLVMRPPPMVGDLFCPQCRNTLDASALASEGGSKLVCAYCGFNWFLAVDGDPEGTTIRPPLLPSSADIGGVEGQYVSARPPSVVQLSGRNAEEKEKSMNIVQVTLFPLALDLSLIHI